MQARLLYGGGGEIQLTAAGTHNPGDVITAAGIPAVVGGSQPIATGDRFTAYTKGVFEMACATATTFNAGVEVEWDDTNDLVVAATFGDFDLGRTVDAKVSGPLVAIVNLGELTT